MTFRRGVAHLEESVRGGDALREAYHLPDEEKERLCRSLLAEFGVTQVRPSGDGELIHGCVLPFSDHKDQDLHPTASLNYKKLTYNCLGTCGAGGSLIWFVAICRDTSGEEARRWLADQTGFGSEEQSLSSLLEYFDSVYDRDRKIDQPMPKMNAKVLDPWLVLHPYMTEVRGISEETLMKFRVGYGVIRLRIRGKKYVQSHRIVIPHFWKDDLVGWQTRRLIKDGTPKYKNSPDFPKDRTLYNFDPKQERVVLVESPMNVLSKDHLGHLEATFGARVTDRQMRLISIHHRVVLFMDNDEAGWKATQRLGDFLSSYSIVEVANNPWAADPADMDDETYRGCVEEVIPYALWRPPMELKVWEKEMEIA